jgi:hypothetical protein
MDLSYNSNSGEKRLRSGTGPGRIHYRICRNGISLYQARHDVPVNVTGYALEHALVEPLLLDGTASRSLARSLYRGRRVPRKEKGKEGKR